MAQGRMIRKSIATDSKVMQLSNLSKLLYTWSILFADRNGRINADPTYIEYIIGRNLDLDIYGGAEELIFEWANQKLCIIYEDTNGRYVQFNNFRRLQGMENDSGTTALYKRERASVFPEPDSCKIIAGQSHCNLQAIAEQPKDEKVQYEVPKQTDIDCQDEFIDQIRVHGHAKEAYESLNAKEVIDTILRFIHSNKDIMVPAGSCDWNNVTSESRGIAKQIGAIVTPVRLSIILEYIKHKAGFVYGPVSPLVLKLVKEWNDTELKALEGL